jgi:germination protein M
MKRGTHAYVFLLITLMIILMTGCILGPSDDTSAPIDPPQINYEDLGEMADNWIDISQSDQDASSVFEAENRSLLDRTLYLFNHQGYVVPVNVQLPVTESAARQVIQHLVVGGPVTNMLPSGMRAVIPAGTDFSIRIDEDHTATVDFNSQFKEYQAEDEKGILEAITWSLTEFDNIDRVILKVNGYKLESMPVNQTPVGDSLTRRDGINIEVSHPSVIGQGMAVTLYFLGQNLSATHDYFVPVTRIVPRQEDLVKATVQELVAGPMLHSGLFSADLIPTTSFDISVNEGTAIINFDEQFLRYTQEKMKVSDNALTAIVLSLTELGAIQEVQFMVNNETRYVSTEGVDLSTPVSRPIHINATGF